MKKKADADVVGLFHSFQRDVLDNKPSFSQMYDDVRMMQFKVRPVNGDVSELNFDNDSFIEALWSLGKLDQFFHAHVTILSKEEKKVFYKLFDSLYQQYQGVLNGVNLRPDQFDRPETRPETGFEVEIFREKNRMDN
jgi:hypothetical protein